MRFLFLTDTHWRSDTPKSRIDDIYRSQFEELAEVRDIINSYSVDAILHGGDFFNSPKPPHELVADIMGWCKSVGKPIYVAIGNHDVAGYNLESIRNSGLGVLFEAGVVQPIDTLMVWENPKLVLKAVHSQLNFDQDYTITGYDDYKKIIVSHNYIIPHENMPFEFRHPKDISTNADLVLCGHYHVPFDYDGGKTYWINPGALSRWSISEKGRTPTVLLVDVDDQIHITPILLKSAKPGIEIFNVLQYEIEKKSAANIQEFIDSLENTQFSNVDLEQVIVTSGQTQQIDPAIIEKALLKVRDAKEKMK